MRRHYRNSVYKDVDVEIDLEDFDDEDLIRELEYRGKNYKNDEDGIYSKGDNLYEAKTLKDVIKIEALSEIINDMTIEDIDELKEKLLKRKFNK